MFNFEEMRELIQQYLSTRRGIATFEHKALKKLGKPVNGPLCSFCGAADSETPLMVEGSEGAFICAGCLDSLSNLVGSINDQKPSGE